MRLLTLARDLGRRKARDRDALFVVEGVRAVEELLRSGHPALGILVAPQLVGTERGKVLRDAIAARGVEVSEVSEREFASAASTESPQGVLAVVPVPAHGFGALGVGAVLRLLVLDAVQDPGNVGTIVRTAAALGADATVALPGTVDLWNAKVVRSTMGACFHHVAFHASWEDLRGFLGSHDVALWAAEGSGEPIGHPEPPARLALVVGNEGAGLSPHVLAGAQRRVSIPIALRSESLNVAVATGILLHLLRP